MSENGMRCPDHLKWVADHSRVIIVDEERRLTTILQDEEALIWNWLALGYSYRRLHASAAALWAATPQAADALLTRLLANWQKSGLLHRESG